MMTLMEAMQQIPHAPEPLFLTIAKVAILLIGSPAAILALSGVFMVYYAILKNMALQRGWHGLYCDLRSLIDWMAAE